ncbi:hypothetical protein JTE90_008268 [Oedothorax gibbosus]|uniref:Uncharacterized protein n=1 Tax=Oedothorax gibbosus TaxID=931172 RepID=A0AAV6UIL6_9ARAC|nr:hypothetical protein JTE90_008268 [Oedothorax gibbosus]
MDILKKLDTFNGYVPASMCMASLAYVAGYLIRVLEREIPCIDCLRELSVASCSSPLLSIVKALYTRKPSSPTKMFSPKHCHLSDYECSSGKGDQS